MSPHFLPAWLVPEPEKLGTQLVRLALTVVAAWVLQRLGFLLVRRAERWFLRAAGDRPPARQRARTLGQTTRHLVTTAVAAGAILHGLDVMGWDVKPLLVGASILGAALGFGAQWLVRDVIAGAFILVEDQFSVGDAIEVSGAVATVEDVTLRATRLRDYQGRLMFVPNGEMRVVVNHSRDWRRTLVDVALAPNQDLARALAAAAETVAELAAAPEWRAQALEPPQVVGLERISPEGVTLRVAARTAPGAPAAAIAYETRRRLLARLRAAGVLVAGGEASVVPPPAGAAGA